MSSIHWTTEPNGCLEIKLSKNGFGSIAPKTVIEVFQNTVAKHGLRKAMCVKPMINVIVFIKSAFSYLLTSSKCVSIGKTS
jgi:hypothetical protein